MPKRTTPFQAVVHLLRQQTADPGSTVTESKLLPDSRPGVDPREVDVVIEGLFNGDPVTTCIEVIEHGRKASVVWVDAMINKHRTLPTNLLILASKSGFSRNAVNAVKHESKWVRTMEPTMVDDRVKPGSYSLYVDRIDLTPRKCILKVEEPGGPIAVHTDADTLIFDAAGTVLGQAIELAREVANLRSISNSFMVSAHNHNKRDALTHFTVGMQIAGLDYFLRKDATATYHRILALEVQGDFAFSQTEHRFTENELDGKRMGMGEGEIFGRKAVWVATANEETGQSTVSWRVIDKRPLLPESPPITLNFPGLTTIPSPAVIDEATAPSVPPEPGSRRDG